MIIYYLFRLLLKIKNDVFFHKISATFLGRIYKKQKSRKLRLTLKKIHSY